MSDHEQWQPAPRRGKVLEAARAERMVFTRCVPKFRQCAGEIPPHAGEGVDQLTGRSGWASRAGPWSAPGLGS